MPILPTGLQRHPKSSVYYFRRRIPTDLLSSYPGKKEVGFSLKTKNYRTAVDRLRIEDAKLTREWQLRRQQLADKTVREEIQAVIRIDSLSPENIEAICRHVEAVSLAGDEERVLNETYTIEEIEEYREGYAAANVLLKSALVIGQQDFFRKPLEEFLRLYGYEVRASETEMRRLALAYGRAAVNVNEKLLNRYQGKYEPTPVLARKLETPMLSEVTKAYIEYYKKLDKHAMLRKVQAVMPLLVDLAGDKPIGSLTQTDLDHFFEGVQKLPPRWKDLCRQQRLSARQLVELIEKNASEGKESLGEMSKQSFDGTYLAAVVPFIRYCRTKWQDRGWPMTITTEGIQYTGGRKKSESSQRAFRSTELSRLFCGPEMAALARDTTKAHMYWLPHVGLFTGARVNELCQLNPQTDIRQDEGTSIWYFDITDESSGHTDVRKSVKTKGSKRKVPIHPKLIQLGFLEYVEGLKTYKATLLFPGFPPSVGKASPKAASWFGDFLRDLDLRDETPGAKLVGMHAFRSTLLNRARALRIVNAEVITGHTTKVTQLEQVQDGQVKQESSDVVRTYEGDFPVELSFKILERIHFGDLQFHVPISTKEGLNKSTDHAPESLIDAKE